MIFQPTPNVNPIFRPNRSQRLWQAGGDALAGIGQALASQGPSQYPVSPFPAISQGLAQGQQMGRQRQDDYRQQAMDDLARQQAEQQQAEFLMKQEQYQNQQAQAAQQKKYIDDAIMELPPEQQALARANPDEFMKHLFDQKLPKPTDQPTSVEEFNFAQGNPAYQEWLTQQANLKKPTTNINMPSPLTPDQIGQAKFGEEAAKANVAMFADSVKGGQSAARSLGDIKMLGALVKSAPTGAGQPLVNATAGYAKRLGIDVSDVANLPASQQIQSIVARIVPTLRPPGSGTMSDRDVELFQQSLPSLVNTPEGNQAIVANLEKIARRSMQEAAISNKALSGQITPSDARSQIEALGPLDLVIPQEPNEARSKDDRASQRLRFDANGNLLP